MPLLRDQILRSNLRTTPEGLVSVALFAVVITAIVSGAVTYYGLFRMGIVWFIFCLLAVPIVYLIITNLPKLSASGRGSGLENELPFVLGYMSVLVGGGVSPMETLRRISSMDTLPSARKEAKRIMVDVEVFGLDPISAMENGGRLSPSKNWSEFLLGYTAVLKTGGDFVGYIQTKLRDLVSNRAAQVKRSSDTTGTIAEAYLTITVVLGMTLYTLYMIQTMVSRDLSSLTSLYFFDFIIVPLLSVAFVYLIDAVQTKWPYTDYRPYRAFAMAVPIGAVVFFVPIPIPLYLHTSLALGVTSFVPAALAYKYTRERRKLERALPDFIADVTEGRKTGLSPEQAIERLSDRNYGMLTKHVKKMAAQLSWGVALSKVISTFTSNVGSWITKVTGTLLVEVVDVGGGTVRSFTEMASFAKDVNELESERRAALRPFVFITYVAGVMVILTTFIMVYMLAAPASLGLQSASLSGSTIDVLLTTAVFDSFVIGLVAGKMGESSLADGFKHGLALVVVSVISVAIARYFISIPV